MQPRLGTCAAGTMLAGLLAGCVAVGPMVVDEQVVSMVPQEHVDRVVGVDPDVVIREDPDHRGWIVTVEQEVESGSATVNTIREKVEDHFWSPIGVPQVGIPCCLVGSVLAAPFVLATDARGRATIKGILAPFCRMAVGLMPDPNLQGWYRERKEWTPLHMERIRRPVAGAAVVFEVAGHAYPVHADGQGVVRIRAGQFPEDVITTARTLTVRAQVGDRARETSIEVGERGRTPEPVPEMVARGTWPDPIVLGYRVLTGLEGWTERVGIAIEQGGGRAGVRVVASDRARTLVEDEQARQLSGRMEDLPRPVFGHALPATIQAHVTIRPDGVGVAAMIRIVSVRDGEVLGVQEVVGPLDRVSWVADRVGEVVQAMVTAGGRRRAGAEIMSQEKGRPE